MKKYIYKVYEKDGTTLLATLNKEVVSLPSFTTNINGGQGNITIDLNLPFDNFEPFISAENIVRIFAISEVYPLGKLIYSGVISQPYSYTKGSKQGVGLEVLGLVSYLTRGIYRESNALTFTLTSEHVSDMLEGILDHFGTKYPTIYYTEESIQHSDPNRTYTFDCLDWLKSIKEAFDLSAPGKFWRIDPDGLFSFLPKPTEATHRFTFWKDIEEFEARTSVEKVVNVCVVKYASGGVYTAADNDSIAAYGRREVVLTDTKITDEPTAQNKAEKYVEENKSPKAAHKLRINSLYDIESIKVGDTCKLLNFNNEVLQVSDNLLISQISYSPDAVTLQIEEVTSFGEEFLQSTKKPS